MSAASLPPDSGAYVRISFRKWDESPHWTSGEGAIYLGEDECGWWLGWPAGTRYTRPGLEFDSDGLQVGCFPRDRWHSATFFGVDTVPQRLYIDVATPAQWAVGADGVVEIRSIDLDLDVIERWDGEVILDDEDEFEEHRVDLCYPTDVIEAALTESQRLLTEVRGGDPRFSEELAEHWRGEYRRLTGSD